MAVRVGEADEAARQATSKIVKIILKRFVQFDFVLTLRLLIYSIVNPLKKKTKNLIGITLSMLTGLFQFKFSY